MNAAPYIQPHPIDISTATQNEIQIIINAFVYAALFAYENGNVYLLLPYIFYLHLHMV